MYTKNFNILTASFIAIYIVMYFHTSEMVLFSATRLYMTIFIICPMALIILGFIHKMYANKKWNISIVVAFTAVFIIAIILVRPQTFIGDVYYLKGMIPHHSIAILTSKRADITAPEVRDLADEIIMAQEEQIAQKKVILKRIK